MQAPPKKFLPSKPKFVNPVLAPKFISPAQERTFTADAAVHAPVVHHGGYSKKSKGKVGPVYTFVKTDHHGNAKWGVRHVVGAEYGGHH